MRWGTSGVAALAGVLALMGCSSAEEKDYLREANAICADAKKHLEKIPTPSSRAQEASAAKRKLSIREEAIKKFGELPPPRKISGAADGVFQDLEARQERARALQHATEEKDVKEVREIRKEARTEGPFEAGRARAADLADCAELGGC